MLRVSRVLVMAVLSGCLVSATFAEEAPAENAPVVLENEYLKVSVSPVGARIVSYYDKLHQREAVKTLPNQGGMNVIRFGAAMNVNDMKSHYNLELTKLPDGGQKLVATTECKPTDEVPPSAVVTKEYVLSPGSSCLQMALEIRNTGDSEIGLIPWVWNLLARGMKELPEEAHMTQEGAYLYGKPNPIARTEPVSYYDRHYFPASNWTSSVILPVADGSETLALVTRSEDMLKVYNWNRASENFATQELIAAPMFAAPGKSARWNYDQVMTAAVRNIVYCSPDLVIGATPHPTWITAADQQLTLEFSASRELANVVAHCKLVEVGKPDDVLSTADLKLPVLSPKDSSKQTVPVKLQDGKCYQLRLTFTRDGKPYNPGESVAEGPEVNIPLIVGKQDHPPVVFADETRREGRLRHLEPQARKAKQSFTSPAFDAYQFPTAQRAFRADTFESAGTGPLQMYACAGEYESFQVVLTPKTQSEQVYDVQATPLKGTSGQVAAESVNDFIYVPVKMPSLYNALFRLGDYPEALQPTTKVTLAPQGNHPLFVTYHVPAKTKPGVYRGSLVLSQNGAKQEIPVEMTVWNIEIPLRSKWFDFASSLKGDTFPVAKHPDGTPISRPDQLNAIVDMHLKYRVTPCDAGVGALLLRGDYTAFDREMQKYIDRGATKVFLGNIPLVIKSAGPRLPEIEKHLEQKGWTDYFYVRPGFDEASSDLMPKIRAVCEQWRKLSHIRIMETYYNNEAQDLFGYIDIWSRSFPVPPWLEERRAAGDTFWKVNAMPGTMETEPWESGRRRYVQLWDHYFTGTYTWSIKAWGGVNKWGEDYWCDGGVGNLSAVLMWPREDGTILSTIRLEAMRDGLEDNAMLWMLREKVKALQGKTPQDPAQAKALADARTFCNSGMVSEKLKSAGDVEQMHQTVGNLLSVLNTAP